MTVQAVSPLFAGILEYLGGLSNEGELAKVCPEEFRRNNPWSDYVSSLFRTGNADMAGWKWKSDNQAERRRQMEYFLSLIDTFDLKREDKEAVTCWMLSEMLVEVPSK